MKQRFEKSGEETADCIFSWRYSGQFNSSEGTDYNLNCHEVPAEGFVGSGFMLKTPLFFNKLQSKF